MEYDVSYFYLFYPTCLCSHEIFLLATIKNDVLLDKNVETIRLINFNKLAHKINLKSLSTIL